MRTLTPEWADYELLDTGAGKKLERFAAYTLIRPEPQATWPPALPAQRWSAADTEFVKKTAHQGEWKFRPAIPERWAMRRGHLRFWVQPAPSGHVGVFPDQACHWDWIAETIRRAGRPVRMLSLFGHTGLATLAAAAAGAEVTHVDASRKAVAGARENQALSGLNERPIRWIVDDALTFVRRETRRGKKYEAMVLDPPKFGRGPNRKIWKLQEALPGLLGACSRILSAEPVFVLLNVYTTVVTEGRAEEEARELGTHLQEMIGKSRTNIEKGELMLADAAERRISTSVFARASSRPS